jgi:hypothetical protein
MENFAEPNVENEAHLHRGQGLDWVTFQTFETGDFSRSSSINLFS